jgi:AhpD family alkylhydroperoxidase
MPHITLPEGLPGITGPLAFRPETAKPMRALAEFLLRGPNTLSRADREIVATYTSSQNDCHFCQTSHGAAAAHHLGGPSELAANFALISGIKRDFESAPISAKLKALLNIADTSSRVASASLLKTLRVPVKKVQLTPRFTTLF